MSASTSIDLIITDIVMPHLGGAELAQRLTAARPGIRVLFLSGHTDDATLRAEISHDAVDFIAKPFSPSLLARKVREVLDRAPAGREPTAAR
jgi:DNA-binding NtrC family response regulator